MNSKRGEEMELLQIQEIEEGLSKNREIGKTIEYYQEIDSTHLYAKEIANQENSNGKIILAEQQTGGIGTKGRKWYTGAGKNIAATIILKPKWKAKDIEGLTKKIAQWIQESIFELYGYSLTIKEPNDLLLNQKKICGILTEIHTRGENINYLLISFGFNVNETVFSEETKEIATSLQNEYQKEFSREEILIQIIKKIEEEIEG